MESCVQTTGKFIRFRIESNCVAIRSTFLLLLEIMIKISSITDKRKREKKILKKKEEENIFSDRFEANFSG